MRVVSYLSKSVIEDNCKCAGVFMLRTNSDDKQEILLVESKRKDYKYSFPKGKRNKGEDTLTAAKRELYEETGLEPDDYYLNENKWYIEYISKTGKPHIIYYLGILKNYEKTLTPIDTREIVSAGWFSPENIYAMKKTFCLQRRQIVTRAMKDQNITRATPIPLIETVIENIASDN